jgi:hypothetical protein
MGIDDAEMPVTSKDDGRALNIILMDDNSVARRMVPRKAVFQDENEKYGAPEVIQDDQDTPVVRDEEGKETQA